uniref:Uncharacterized protein n=1 Tax=Myotis myotis TaxID=51298 RepID=A0A7J7XI87_MYOMY|nr:hypothetical protein mMyoMyo1_011785 [Myotis myotis]
MVAAESKRGLKVSDGHEGRAMLPAPLPLRGTPRLHHSMRKAGPSQVYCPASSLPSKLCSFCSSSLSLGNHRMPSPRTEPSPSFPSQEPATHLPCPLSHIFQPFLGSTCLLEPPPTTSHRLLPVTNFGEPTSLGTTVTAARPPFSSQ